MSLRDRVAAINDVPEVTINVPEWDNEAVLFRGLSFQTMFDLDLDPNDGDSTTAATAAGLKLLQATAYDPETKELAFSGDDGAAFLMSRGTGAITYMIKNGANVVLGVDSTPGKDSSSTGTETPISGD